MNDIIREPYELSIWELQDIKYPIANLMPPLSSIFKDEWEEFSDSPPFFSYGTVKLLDYGQNLDKYAKDWSSFSFSNNFLTGSNSDSYIYSSKEVLNPNENYVFFIELQNVTDQNFCLTETGQYDSNAEHDLSRWPTVSVYYKNSDSTRADILIDEFRIQNGIFKYALDPRQGTKIKLKFNIPSSGTKFPKMLSTLVNFQIRLSLFDKNYAGNTPPTPFPLYKIGQTQLQEKKKYVIGSSSMTVPYRIVNPMVRNNVNGDKTLSFSLYSRYLDEETGDFVDNPFVKFLHNETYLKLHRGENPTEGWEEYVIKNISENSTNSLYTYTAKRASIIELSKTGYNLEFSSELMNNQGTAIELTQKVLEGTDWSIDESNCEKLWGTIAEPVYKARLADFENIVCIRQIKPNIAEGYEQEVQKNPPIPQKNQFVYIPYSSYQNFKETNEIQVLWRENFEEIEGDDQNVIYNANSYLVSGSIVLQEVEVSEGLKGENLQKRIRSSYLANLGKVAEEWENERGDLVYKITDVEYKTVIGPSELIVNGKDFVSTTGWRTTTKTSVQLSTKNDDVQDILKEDYIVYLLLQNLDKDNTRYIYNAAIRSNISLINEDFLEGNEYCLYLKGKHLNGIKSVKVVPYEYNEKNELVLQDSKTILEFGPPYLGSGSKTLYSSCNYSIPKQKILDENVGLFFELSKPEDGTTINNVYLEEVSLFKRVIKDGEDLTPVTVLSAEDLAGEKIVKENYFNPLVGNNANASSIDELYLEPLATEQGEEVKYFPRYYGNYEKVSSIQVSKSNRFNILQEICEAFECWMDFKIFHNAQGKIIDKKIVLKTFIGDNKKVGFSYGLNLKDIGRTLVSDQIVTKLIVESNNNENALNGFCTIARAPENVSRDTALFNFDYYINQGMLDAASVFEDFYGEMGLINRLSKINIEMQELNDELTTQQLVNTQYQSYRSAAKEAIEAISGEIDSLKQDFYDRTLINVEDAIKDTDISKYNNNASLKNIIVDINFQEKTLSQKKAELDAYNLSLSTVLVQIDNLEKKIEKLLQDQNSYLTIFNEKYGNYIQEGSWNDESYYDDTLYYLDAQNVLYNSAFPKVSYTINVIDISPLGEEFKPFIFKIGDKTYIEDVEFFGWNTEKTAPYKEEVVISETEEYLDSPDLNKIVVQNYKTQFEDLFQRISATTQSLQLVAGAYQRAANKITSTNTIDSETIENSFVNKVINLQNAGNMSVKWTPEGMVISNQAEPNNKLRLSNAGIAQTGDGGETWKMLVINGRGITANSIVTGTLDANKISIKSGDAATFIWDAKGLRAYETKWNQETNQLISVNLNNYIEFNDKGLIAYKTSGDKVENPFKLTPDGQLELTGKVIATEGRVGGWYIKDSYLANKEDYNDADFWIAPLGIEQEINEDKEKKDCVIYVNKFFRVFSDGVVYATNANISGCIEATSGKIGGWTIEDETLHSKLSEETKGIVLDANNSMIKSYLYESSEGKDGWCITNDEAIFNNITARGAIKCAVFEYAEVQAIGGIMIIRPSTTIKDYIIEDIEGRESKRLTVLVETKKGFLKGDWCRFTSDSDAAEEERTTEERENGIASGINTDLYQLLDFFDTNEGPWLRFEVKKDFDVDSLRGMGLIDLGLPSHKDENNKFIYGNIGLGLNGSTNDSIIPPSSFSVFSLEQTANESGRYCLVPHVVLGLLPEAKVLKIDSENEEKYDKNYANTYGLYADNVYLSGHIEATSGKIGNMEIQNLANFIDESQYSIVIVSENGIGFIDEDGKEEKTKLVCEIYKNNVIINKNGGPLEGFTFTYQWYKDNEKIENENQYFLTINNVEIGVTNYSCKVTLESNSNDG